MAKGNFDGWQVSCDMEGDEGCRVLINKLPPTRAGMRFFGLLLGNRLTVRLRGGAVHHAGLAMQGF